MRNRLPLNAIAITGREKKSVGIDFDLPIRKKERKIERSEPVYLEKHYDEYKLNKNPIIFEEIVDMLMLDYFDDKFKSKIKNMPRHKKRLMILALLDKDRNLFMKAKALFEDNYPKLKHIKDLITILREYVRVGEVEKKKFGEVMTPLELVKDMLHTLPEKVWTNPNFKWLDPCNGTGPFLSTVVYKLMQGLKKWEPDEEKRYKHIVENMIYSCELQPKNMFLWITLMDPYDEYSMNVYTGSFLDGGFDKHMKEVWGLEKFDIIVGNPPYNDDSNNKGNTLWDKFIPKSFDILNQDRYFVMVHPSGWRNIEGKFSKVKDLLLSRDILYLNLNSFEDGMRVFNAGTNFDYYCVRNSNTKCKTKLVDIDNVEYLIDLKSVDFIPNCNIHMIYSLISSDVENRVKVIVSYDYEPRKEWMSDLETQENKYPCVYSIKSGGILNLKWSKINTKGHFGVSKIICGNGANPTFIKDFEGNYGMTQWAFGIIDDDIDNLSNIFSCLNSQGIKEVTRATKFVSTNGNPIIYPKIISLFKKDFWKNFI